MFVFVGGVGPFHSHSAFPHPLPSGITYLKGLGEYFSSVLSQKECLGTVGRRLGEAKV